MPPLTAVGLSCSSGATSVPTSPALPVRSVASEPPRRLDTVQFGKIKAADRLQLVGERGRAEIVGQVVEPPLIFILEVQQGAYRLVPALRFATGGRAAFGTAPAVVARWSTPWSSAHRYVTGRDLTAHGVACVVGGSAAEAPRRRLFSMAVRRR